MKTLTIIALLGLCSPFTLGEPENTQPIEPTPEIKLDLIEPDWSLLGDGNWSPWFVDASGETVWNPSASFNAWMDTIPKEDKAWPALAEVYFEHGRFFRTRVNGVIPEQRGVDLDGNGIDDWDQMVALLQSKKIQRSITQANTAINKPYLGEWMHYLPSQALMNEIGRYKKAGRFELRMNPSTSSAFNPNIDQCQTLSRIALGSVASLLTSNSAFHAQAGRINECVEQLITVFSTQKFASEHPSIRTSQTTTTIQNEALSVLRWALYTYGEQFTEEQLAALDRSLASHYIAQLDVIETQLAFHDAVRRNEDLLDAGLRSTSYAQLQEPIREILSLFDMPLSEFSSASNIREGHSFDLKWFNDFDGYEHLQIPIDPIGRAMLDDSFPQILRYFFPVIDTQSFNEAIRIVIASHRHKLRHGQFPDDLKAIDSDLTNFTTTDLFTLAPLHYLLTENGPLVYALGDDEVDDLGIHTGQSRIRGYTPDGGYKPDGDYVFYPNPFTTQDHLID